MFFKERHSLLIETPKTGDRVQRLRNAYKADHNAKQHAPALAGLSVHIAQCVPYISGIYQVNLFYSIQLIGFGLEEFKDKCKK